ncbi:hypothetical protein B0A49_13592 [Cryomyces minteri]|uniref:Uncharacterized protein n=1 Tax=Cryomyces minteri TaxID=331657 RepID=A0A4U0UYE1_9PEZI|nr:hypothetical protein B0A49_13592 [Cryomyces minteri]
MKRRIKSNNKDNVTRDEHPFSEAASLKILSDAKNHTSPPYFTKEDDGYDTGQGRRAATRIDEDTVNEEEDYTRTQHCNNSLSKRIA